MKLRWSFAELAADAAVSLIYHPAGRPDELHEMQATSSATGSWAVDMILDPMLIWEYRIVVVREGWQRSTDVRRLDLRKLVETILVLELSHNERAGDWSLLLRQRHPAGLEPYRVARIQAAAAEPDEAAELTVESLDEGGWLVSAPGMPGHLFVDFTFTLNNGASYDVQLSADALRHGTVEGIVHIPPRQQ